MNNYKYIAKDKFGKALSGMLEAANDAEAAEILHKKELIIVSIELSSKKSTASAKVNKDAGVKLDELVVFSRQLATMIDSGISLVHALGILVEQAESKALKGILSEVRNDIEAGANFHESLAKHSGAFSDFFINMVKSGESSGMLDEVLDRLAAYLEKNAALTRKVKSSLVYPAIVISMSLIITAVLLLKVVPTFKGIFDTLGGALPLPTQILIGISDLFRQSFLFVVIGFVVFGFLLGKYIKTEKGAYNFDRVKLRLPVLGVLFRKVAVAKFSRTFATLVKSGVSVLGALDIVGKTSGNKVVEEAIAGCSTAVRSGEPIAKPLSKSAVFPPMVCRMISVGEQTGQLEKMLSKIADFYDEQVDAATSALTSMIEPLVISFLGTIIGGVVISLFLPIFKITELIAK